MSNNNATTGLGIDKTYSTLKLIGGQSIDRTINQFPDLWVKGGVRIKGGLAVCSDSYFEGDLDVKGNLFADVTINLGAVLEANIIGNICSHTLQVSNIYSKGASLGNLTNVIIFNDPPVWGAANHGNGSRNQFWGFQSGVNSTVASADNVAFGYKALNSVVSGDKNVAIGSYALSTNVIRDENVAIGYKALASSSGPRRMVAIGSNVMAHTTATYLGSTVAIGNDIFGVPSYTDATIGRAVVIGNKACQYTQYYAGGSNVFIGDKVAQNMGKTGSAGSYNVAIGSQAMLNHQEGGYCVAVGCKALQGHPNYTYYSYARIGIGKQAGAHNKGEGSLAIGTKAAYSKLNTEAYYTIAIGAYALYNLSNNAHYNCAIGHMSMRGGSGNVNAITGAYNSALGFKSLYNLTTGNYNVAVGFQSGLSLTTGSYNICIGAGADCHAGVNYSIVIGKDAVSATSGELVIGSNVAPVGTITTTPPTAGGYSIPTAVAFMEVKINGSHYRIPLLNYT